MNFRDLIIGDDYTYPLPSEAVKLDGVYLDNTLDGFTTISVLGREIVHLNLRTTGNLNGRDGELFLSSDLPSRLISIKYLLKGSNANEFQERFDAFKSLLFSTRKRKEVGFNDEDWIYFGYPISMNEIEDGLLEVVGTFDILCVNPYKYSELITQTGGGSTATLTINDAESLNYPIKLEEIILSGATRTKIELVNERTGQRIILNGNYSSSDEIKLIFGEQPMILKNGNNITKELAFESSSFPIFEVRNGDSIYTPAQSGTITVNFRSMRL